jgi:hypothetical protein
MGKIAIQEYEALNILNDLVLGNIEKNKEMSQRKIFKNIKKNLNLQDESLWACLGWLYLYGLVQYRFTLKGRFYSITKEGIDFLKEYGPLTAGAIEIRKTIGNKASIICP